MMVWVAFLIAIIPPLVSLIVWRRQKEAAVSILLLSCGMTFFIGTMATVSSEYLVTNPASSLSAWPLSFIAHLSRLILLGCGICILFFFPQKLIGALSWPRRILISLIAYGCFNLLNNLDLRLNLDQQNLYISGIEFYLLLPFLAILLLYLIIMQWKASELKPFERAQVLWLILSCFAAPGLLLLFYLVPLLADSAPQMTSFALLLTALLMYLMVSLGVGQFERLKLEIYTSTIFNWTAFTLTFLNLGIVFISLLGLSEKISTIILFASVLWLYMPLRQWMGEWIAQRYAADSHQQLMNESVIQLVENSLIPTYEAKKAWHDTLVHLFSPLKLKSVEHSEKAIVCQKGQSLLIPQNAYVDGLQLEFAEEGRRLFTSKDAEIAETSSLLFVQLFKQRDEYFSGQTQERNRIRRDLHDQIGHKLLSMIYSARDQTSRSLAKSTMKQLRELISALNNDLVAAEDAISKLKQLTEETCENCDLKILWHQNLNLSTQQKFRSNQYLNIANIFREILNNITKHANATQVTCSATSNSDALSLVISDNGIGFDLENINRGNGLVNIESRAAEIEANIHWSTQAGTQFTLNIPLRIMNQQEEQIERQITGQVAT